MTLRPFRMRLAAFVQRNILLEVLAAFFKQIFFFYWDKIVAKVRKSFLVTRDGEAKLFILGCTERSDPYLPLLLQRTSSLQKLQT